jgi:DNA-binding beta-propeller fold protein YncE/mono/diheme cytochrome c family protein
MREPKLSLVALFFLVACSETTAPVVYVEPTPPPAPSASGTPRPTPTPTPTTNPTPPTPTPAGDLPPLFAEPVRHARAAPLAGGTLLVTGDGTTAVAADPDRDRVFLVDLATLAVRAVPLAENDEPGRVAPGPPGRVFVAARRGGVVAAIDLATGSVALRVPVCNAPRGLAYDAALGRVHVACRSGQLVSLDAATGAVVSTLSLDEDLRDVVVSNGTLVVTRFRSAEVLVADALGQVVRRGTPAPPANIPGMRAAVGFRAIPHPSGTVTIAHQLVSDGALGTGLGAYYGGGCNTGGAVIQALTTVQPNGSPIPWIPPNPGQPIPPAQPLDRPDGLYSASISVPGTVGPTDIAFSPDGTRLALLVPGNAWVVTQPLLQLFVTTIDDPSGVAPTGFGPCGPARSEGRHVPGEPVAVAFDANGRYLVQSREPAFLALEGDIFVPLATDSHFDTGFAMFHMNSNGVSCASCHPEGGDDGHVWSFAGVGLRRSQALEGGVSRRTPFHWSGDLATFDALFDEVMLERMTLPVVPPRTSVAALATWLDTIPALPASDDLDPAAVERGRTLFFDAAIGCSTCHSGLAYADDVAHDVGTGGHFVTPSLLGVGLRAPLFHDGCAPTLRARFGPCGGSTHGNTDALDDAQVDDLVVFMKSL